MDLLDEILRDAGIAEFACESGALGGGTDDSYEGDVGGGSENFC